MKVFEQIPARVKYYLLDWKDRNIDDFHKMYNGRSLNNLTLAEIQELFSAISTNDIICLIKAENTERVTNPSGSHG